MKAAADRLAIALDVDDPERALELARDLVPYAGIFKVSPAHVYARGESFISSIRKLGRKVFLDLKLYDIPETVARLCRQIAGMGVNYVTVHAAGGTEMIRRAVAAGREGEGRCLDVIAVTVLTSFSREQLAKEWKLVEPVEERVAAWAALARDAGAAGIVCAPPDLGIVRTQVGRALFTVVPGIRGVTDAADDQRRTLGPGPAIAAGADVIVVGRPIVASSDPVGAAASIIEQIEGEMK